ncbi:hypothetical protein ACLB2K_060250 [Fragaria x ananassa]
MPLPAPRELPLASGVLATIGYLCSSLPASRSWWSLDSAIESRLRAREVVSRKTDYTVNTVSTVAGLPYLNTSLVSVSCKNKMKQEEMRWIARTMHSWLTRSGMILIYQTLAMKDMDFVPVELDWSLSLEKNKSLIKSFEAFDRTDMTDWRNPTDSRPLCQRVDPDPLFNRTWYSCTCPAGFEGNPYLLQPCRGLGAGIGLLLLLSGAWWIYKFAKKWNNNKLKQMFYKRNGGLLLEQQLSSGDINIERIKLFESKELQRSTDNFNAERMIGQGGQGTVYKGMLMDGRFVAVKKSKMVDEAKLSEFINEVVILSQINHRNIVQLLGCCLETEVPLLVYEFIPNGNLSQYIHEQSEEFPLTWEFRLRIATEIAGALAYLHTSTLFPIYHRDIKSTNILLDDKYRAKIADFGTSRLVAIDHKSTRHIWLFGS